MSCTEWNRLSTAPNPIPIGFKNRLIYENTKSKIFCYNQETNKLKTKTNKRKTGDVFVVPLLQKSWDNWSELYAEIIKNAQIIKESGIPDVLRVANKGGAII